MKRIATSESSISGETVKEVIPAVGYHLQHVYFELVLRVFLFLALLVSPGMAVLVVSPLPD